MLQDNAIEVKKIKKAFKVYLDKGSTIKEKIVSSKRRKYELRQVLDDISFEVKKGEAIGLIGQNGCGKSTTLKLLTKIMYPDMGTIEMKGRVSSLIELGAGFHPDMSGRENIFINASIFGLSHKEIESRLDDIIAFSELEDYIDNPVRTYSSGMYMRLAFSVAINVDADILLIDEILGVGDASFQAKCFNRLREIKANGTTIVIVSHSLGQIEQICERSLWIHKGKIRAEGAPREVHPLYLEYMGQKRQEIADKESERQARKKKEGVTQEENNKRWGTGKAEFTRIELLDGNGNLKRSFPSGGELTIRLYFKVKEAVVNATIGIAVYRSDGLLCYGSNTKIDRMQGFDLNKDGSVEITLHKLNLLEGSYFFDFAIETYEGVAVDFYKEAASMEIYSAVSDVGIMRIEHDWKMNQ